MDTVDLSVSGNSVCSFSMFLCFLIDVLIREFFISLSLGTHGVLLRSGNPLHFLHSAPLQFGAFEPLRQLKATKATVKNHLAHSLVMSCH